MPIILPNTKPRLSSSELYERIKPFQLDRTKYPLVVIGIRGYYLNTMGVAGQNDRNMYDDAIFIDSPNGTVAFNGNTDPSIVRKGSGKGNAKGIAKLKPGLWLAHQFGQHKGKYLALVQLKGEVTVIRDGTPDYEDTGYFGVNIHKGGYNTTSSEGCQTIYPDQYASFIQLVKSEAIRLFADKWNSVTIPYILLENS